MSEYLHVEKLFLTQLETLVWKVIDQGADPWAACTSDGRLSFHWKCMMTSLKVIDYIVVHELCHLHYRDHTDAFWNEVDKVMPDYYERKGWLRQNGASLEL